tara:strand:- start:48 stop:383 length:336 start_codon:yes stop_codon:yes gene_type:complete
LNVKAMTVMVSASVVLTFVSLLTAGLTVRSLQEQRSASCAATLSSLAAVAETSAAGIRPVDARIPPGLSPQLEASFRQQLAATKAENVRRMTVVVSVNKSAAKLRASAFCN